MKKRLLLYWGSPYTFYETIVPLLDIMAEHFRVSVIINDIFMPLKVPVLLESMKKDGLLEEYWIAPPEDKITRNHLFIKSRLKIWQKLDFDIFISGSAAQIIDRYLIECVLRPNALKVCYSPGITYLLRYEDMVRGLLGINEAKTGRSDKPTLLERKAKEFRSLNSSGAKLKWIITKGCVLFNRLTGNFIGKVIYFYNRFLLPVIFTGKVFHSGMLEQLTQVRLDNVDAFILCDNLEARAFNSLFKGNHIYVVRAMPGNICRCHTRKSIKDTVLVILANCFGNVDRLSGLQEEVFYRDISVVLKETGADKVHLRLHPREKGQWPYALEKYLKDNGIDTICVFCNQPIREIVCDYLAVVGCASAALRDGRVSCENAIVIGFIEVSKHFFTNPRFVFGESDGIGWIEEDGSYTPDIFVYKRYIPIAKKTIVEQILELSTES